jgi:two-component system chemotaxis sensor kinase CheA
MNEVIREFLIETHENLAQLDLDLVTLEKDPHERETLARVFRTLHTIKGTAGFLGLQRLQGVAHAAESLLSRLRDGELTFSADIATALLAVVDAVRQMLSVVESTETDGDADFTRLIQTLDRLRSGDAQQAPKDHPTGSVTVLAPTQSAALDRPAGTEASRSTIPTAVVEPPVSAPGEARTPAVSDTALRVDVGLLDKLMTLVGELVLARNQLMQLSSSQEDAALLGTVHRLNVLTTELQVGVMKTRLQPISNIWSKFPRVVRDLALACGKQVRLDMEGQETELDKTIIEAIRDPLTHLVRNAIDHGIEEPADRRAQGKPEQGRLALHAFHEGGKVMIQIADDGKGLDPLRIRAKAIEAKLIDPDQADRLSERELVNLVFVPGFSTADKVTQFSGRGVGMDVVRNNIERIGGTVHLQGQPGRGTTIRMTIPLTLAIIPALTVTAAGDRYAIPQVSLLELVRLDRSDPAQRIEVMHGTPVYRLRGNLLPLVFLNQVLQPGLSPGTAENGATPEGDGATNIVVLQADDRQFGLIVDSIHDTEEIVVKPLQKLLKDLNVFAGATIMGDGRVALILDVLGLAQRTNVVSGVRERGLSETTEPAVAPAADRQTVLLFSAGGGRMAIPLGLVARLEELPRSMLERSGAYDVVQYRGDILPLIDVGSFLNVRRTRTAKEERSPAGATAALDRGTVQVIVYAGTTRQIGLVVDRIIDIAEEAIVARSPAHRPGALFTAVIQGRVTEFLDVEAIVRSLDLAACLERDRATRA